MVRNREMIRNREMVRHREMIRNREMVRNRDMVRNREMIRNREMVRNRDMVRNNEIWIDMMRDGLITSYHLVCSLHQPSAQHFRRYLQSSVAVYSWFSLCRRTEAPL